LSKFCKLTSYAYDSEERTYSAVGTLRPSNIEFILKATLCFLVRSYASLFCKISSAIIVSRINCKVCKSESPGKRGSPLKISANMQPIAQTSIELV
jgi:hypothetical protein